MRKSSEERKAEIIQGALDIASEEGVAKVTTQAIADRVGIAQPTIFRHFKTRDAIFRAALEWVAGNVFKLLEADMSGSRPADKRLKTFLKRHLFLLSKKKGVPRILFSDRLHMEDPALKETVQRIMNRLTERIAMLLQEGIDGGQFDPDIDTEETARIIVALIQGSVMRWSIFDFNYALADQADCIWNLIWPAIRAR
jgi:AcrR family transcriptional regulator